MNRLEDLELDPIVRGQAAARLHSDITAAADRLIEAGDPYAAEFCWRASPVWIYLIRIDEGLSRLAAAAELADDDYHRGRCQQSAAYLAEIADLPDIAARYVAAADTLASIGATSDDPIAVAYATHASTSAAAWIGVSDADVAESLLERAATFSRRIGFIEGLASVASIRAEIALNRRDYDAADALSRETVELARQTRGQPYGRALQTRALLLREFGRHAEADEVFWLAVDALAGEPLQAPYLRQVACSVVLDGPETIPAALELVRRGEAVAAQFGLFDEMAAARSDAGGLHAYDSDRAAAYAASDEALALASRVGLPQITAMCQLRRCCIALMFDDLDAADEALRAARHRDVPSPRTTVFEAALAGRSADPERARKLLATIDKPRGLPAYATTTALTAAALGDPQREEVLAAAHADRSARGYFSLHQLRNLGAGRGEFAYPRDARDFLVRWAKGDS
jgi:tetratricopeptide (TPR) repeat protein